MRVLFIFVLILVILSASACTAGTASQSEMQGRVVIVDNGTYLDISPAQLHDMFENKDFILVNTDVGYVAEIPGTDLFIPYIRVEQYLNQLPQNRTTKIVLYASSSSESSIAAEKLVELGFTNVLNLTDGILGWYSQGYILLTTCALSGRPY